MPLLPRLRRTVSTVLLRLARGARDHVGAGTRHPATWRDAAWRLRVNRHGWPAGPWDDEPDAAAWTYAGLPCLLLRNPAGIWCGYVGVWPGHPAYGGDDRVVEAVEACPDVPYGISGGGFDRNTEAD